MLGEKTDTSRDPTFHALVGFEKGPGGRLAARHPLSHMAGLTLLLEEWIIAYGITGQIEEKGDSLTTTTTTDQSGSASE